MKKLESLIVNLVEQILKENQELASILKLLQSITSETESKYIKIADRLGLKEIGIGNSRIVFEINKNWVLKIVEDSSYNQNINEYKLYHNCAKEHKRYFTQCLPEHGPKFIWIIAENVTPIYYESSFIKHIEKNLNLKKDDVVILLKKDFKSETDHLGYRNIYKIFTRAVTHAVYGDDPDILIAKITDNFLKRSEWFAGLIAALKGCNIDSNDLHYQNWGIRPSTGELVILDYGMDPE